LLGGRGSAYQLPRAGRGWFRLVPRPFIEMELQLFQPNNDPRQQHNLWITVALKYLGRTVDPDWRTLGDQIYRDLRAYLIGTTATVAD
jgi:hypothetical protein